MERLDNWCQLFQVNANSLKSAYHAAQADDPPVPHLAHASPIRSTSFTSSLLITGSDDQRINVFDIRALTSGSSAGGSSRRGQVASLGGHEGWVTCVRARNERLLASG